MFVRDHDDGKSSVSPSENTRWEGLSYLGQTWMQVFICSGIPSVSNAGEAVQEIPYDIGSYKEIPSSGRSRG